MKTKSFLFRMAYILPMIILLTGCGNSPTSTFTPKGRLILEGADCTTSLMVIRHPHFAVKESTINEVIQEVVKMLNDAQWGEPKHFIIEGDTLSESKRLVTFEKKDASLLEILITAACLSKTTLVAQEDRIIVSPDKWK